MTFTTEAFTLTSVARLQRFANEEAGWLVSKLPTCSSFAACFVVLPKKLDSTRLLRIQ